MEGKWIAMHFGEKSRTKAHTNEWEKNECDRAFVHAVEIEWSREHVVRHWSMAFEGKLEKGKCQKSFETYSNSSKHLPGSDVEALNTFRMFEISSILQLQRRCHISMLICQPSGFYMLSASNYTYSELWTGNWEQVVGENLIIKNHFIKEEKWKLYRIVI